MWQPTIERSAKRAHLPGEPQSGDRNARCERPRVGGGDGGMVQRPVDDCGDAVADTVGELALFRGLLIATPLSATIWLGLYGIWRWLA